MATFTQIGNYSRPGNIDFLCLEQWEAAVVLVAKTDPDNPAFKGRRGSVSWYKHWPGFDEPTYVGGVGLWWNSPLLLVLPPEPAIADRPLWEMRCTPNWQIHEWTLEVWRAEGVPTLGPGVIDFSEILQALEGLGVSAELTLDGLAQLQALTAFTNQGLSELATGQQRIAVALALLQEQVEQLQLSGGGNNTLLGPGTGF